MLWLKLLSAKYRISEIFSSTPNSCSPFWHSIHKVKEHFRMGVRFSPSKNSSISFWKDVWIGEVPLFSRFPTLFAKSSDTDLTMAQTYSEEGWHIFFRRALDQGDLQAWSEIVWVGGGHRAGGCAHHNFVETYSFWEIFNEIPLPIFVQGTWNAANQTIL
jgi:hypothetical protein